MPSAPTGHAMPGECVVRAGDAEVLQLVEAEGPHLGRHVVEADEDPARMAPDGGQDPVVGVRYDV